MTIEALISDLERESFESRRKQLNWLGFEMTKRGAIASMRMQRLANLRSVRKAQPQNRRDQA